MTQTYRPLFAPAGAEVEIDVVLFAGGGGSELARRRARPGVPSIAINHSPVAMAMHRANHPDATHYIEDVYTVDPRAAAAGRRVGLLWLSPDCTHHSRAKGGKPRQQKIRGLAWSAIPWAKHCRPRAIMLENVREWLEWGPVDRATGMPIKARRGQTYRAWKRKLERLGYTVESRILRACDYGTPTTRERAFVVALLDGRSARWPSPTHGPMGSLHEQPYRTAAECIDWSISCPSIFERRRPLAEKTLARIARGLRKFVLDAARPFLIAVNHGGVGRRDHRVHDVDGPMPTVTGGQRGGHAVVAPMVVKAKTHGGGGNEAMPADEPLRTVTSSKRGEFAIAAPYLVHRSNGERPGQAPRIYDVNAPLGTVVAQGQKHALASAFLARHYSDRPTGGWPGGAALDRPIGTVTAQDHHALVASHLVKLRGTSAAHLNSSSSSITAPVPTISASGTHVAHVAAFLARYNRTGEVRSASDPLGCVDTTDRYAAIQADLVAWSPEIDCKAHLVYELLVKHGYDGPGLDHKNRIAVVTIGGAEYVIADVGMRMLVPRELFRAMGFPDDYVIDPVGPNGKTISKTAQIRACGNAVPPQPVEALIVANLGAA